MTATIPFRPRRADNRLEHGRLVRVYEGPPSVRRRKPRQRKPPTLPPGCTVYTITHQGRYVLDPAAMTLRLLPRWDDPEFCVGEQPRPIKVKIIAHGSEPKATIIRDWAPSDVPRCRLCATCNAYPAVKGDTLVCFREVKTRDITQRQAAMSNQRPEWERRIAELEAAAAADDLDDTSPPPA